MAQAIKRAPPLLLRFVFCGCGYEESIKNNLELREQVGNANAKKSKCVRDAQHGKVVPVFNLGENKPQIEAGILDLSQII